MLNFDVKFAFYDYICYTYCNITGKLVMKDGKL